MEKLLSDTAVVEWVKIVPSMLWIGFCLLLLLLFYKPIRYDILPKLMGFKIMGAEFSFVKTSIDDAIEVGEKSPEWNIKVPEKGKAAALKRAKRNIDVFKNARILWVDDLPKNNSNERRMFRQLQVSVDNVTSSKQALELLKIDDYDLIISDIARKDDEDDNGIKFLSKLRNEGNETPLIFYIGNYVAKEGVPKHAFGITDRPGQLLHLVLDVLERKM